MGIHRTRRLVSATAISTLVLGAGLTATTISPASAARPIPTGSLSGTVLAADGTALPGATVWLFSDIDGDGAYSYAGDIPAGPSGDYVFAHLAAGSYKVAAESYGFVEEYYNDAATIGAATPLAIGAGNTAVPAMSLATAAPTVVTNPATTDLAGTVTNAATGKNLPGAALFAYDATTGHYIADTRTDSAGNYAFDGLDGHTAVKVATYLGGTGGRLGYRDHWSGGSRTKSAATPIALTPGTPVASPIALTQVAGISGRVLNPAGVAPYAGSVSVYDADSNEVDGAMLRPDGTFFLNDDLNPGEAYRVKVSGTDYPGNDYDNDALVYVDGWFADGNSFTTATPVVAGASGTFTPNINVTLRDSLVAFEAPSITGSFVIGQTLTGNVGRWNRNGNSTFALQWLRGTTVVGTAPTYVLTGADAGQPIALRVTVTNFDGPQRTATVTSAATVAKYAATVSAKKGKTVKKGKKAGKTAVVIRVKAGTQAAAAITGTVKVTEGKKKVGSFKVKNGKATFWVTKPGKHKYKLVYSGNGTTLADDGTATIKVRKAKHKKK